MKTRTQRGFTLIEIVIAGVILLLVVVLALSTFIRSNTTVGESLAITDAANRANQLSMLLSRQLNGARFEVLGGSALSPAAPPWFTNAQFRPNAPIDLGNGLGPEGLDYATGTARVGAIHEIRFVYDPGEAGGGSGNDVDDDRDGLIDEGQLELWADTNADDTVDTRLAVLARNVASAPEVYPIGGTRGVFMRFNHPPTNETVASTVGMSQVNIEFSILTRLPQRGAVHAETRTMTIPYRNQAPTTP